MLFLKNKKQIFRKQGLVIFDVNGEARLPRRFNWKKRLSRIRSKITSNDARRERMIFTKKQNRERE